MIGNSHIQIVMNLIRITNERKKLAGKKFKDELELREIESNFIRFANFYNRIINFFVNNRASLWIKEVFYSMIIPYPEFLYDDFEGYYFKSISKSYITKNRLLRLIRLILKSELVVVEVSLATSPDHALDTSKIGAIKKRLIKRDVNKFFRGEKIFRFKRILEYKRLS